MGSLQQDLSGNYHACFRFGGKRFKRSLKTTNEGNTRAKKTGKRGRKLSPVTIRKELATLSGVWNWAVTGGLVGPLPNKGLRYPKAVEKPPLPDVGRNRTTDRAG